MRSLRTILLTASAVLVLAALTGCPAPPTAGTGTTGAEAGANAANTAGSAGGNPGLRASWGPDDGIVIGSYMSLTGGIATYGQSSNMAMGMAVEELNDKGGVAGKLLRLVVEDSASKPEDSASAVQRLIDVQHAVVVVGEVASSNSLAAAPICQKAGIPMLTPSSTNPNVTRVGDMIFRCCFTDDQQGAYVAVFAYKHKGYRRGAILKDINSDYSKGLTEVIKARFEAMGGTIETIEAYQQDDKDFKATLTKLAGLDLDVIFVPGYYTEVASIIKQARGELGITTPLVGADGWDSPELVKIAGDYVNQDCYFVNHYSKSEDRPKVKDFVLGFKTRYGAEPDALAACAYDAIYIVADAIRRAGSTDAQALRAALAQTKDVDGVTGRITINAERNASKPCVVLGFENGEQVIKSTLSPSDI